MHDNDKTVRPRDAHDDDAIAAVSTPPHVNPHLNLKHLEGLSPQTEGVSPTFEIVRALQTLRRARRMCEQNEQMRYLTEKLRYDQYCHITTNRDS